MRLGHGATRCACENMMRFALLAGSIEQLSPHRKTCLRPIGVHVYVVGLLASRFHRVNEIHEGANVTNLRKQEAHGDARKSDR